MDQEWQVKAVVCGVIHPSDDEFETLLKHLGCTIRHEAKERRLEFTFRITEPTMERAAAVGASRVTMAMVETFHAVPDIRQLHIVAADEVRS